MKVGILVFGAKVAETVPFVEAKVGSWKISKFSAEIRQRNGLKLLSRGTHIPPTSMSMSMSTTLPTQVPALVQEPLIFSMNVAQTAQTAPDNVLETSNVLSDANKVLYMTPNKLYPHTSSDVYIQESRFNGPQGKYIPTPTTNVYTTTISPRTVTPAVDVNRTIDGKGVGPDGRVSTNSTNINPPVPENASPPWLSQLFNQLDTRLSHIDNQLASQNSRWQHMDNVLQSQNTMLQNQNARMLKIEKQMTEINAPKNSVTQIEAKMVVLDSDLTKTNQAMSEYQHSIDTYSDMYDEIRREQESNDSIIDNITKRLEKLENDQSSLQSNQNKSDNTLIDLQCRSMRDNLIFTGISETPLQGDEEYEDVERTLLHFLETEMGIYRIIDFHRVHRLGAYHRDTQDTNPRPIIAKFEKFKDREFVRSRARETLRGKRFGIREQFPREIEEKRKLLYPVAKEARQNKDKVRMIRDKLFINNREVQIDSVETYERQRTANTRKHQINAWGNQKSDRTAHRGERVFYRSRGRSTCTQPRTYNTKKTEEFSIPLSNPFGPLAEYNETPKGHNNQTTTASKKHPASSPLDDTDLLKKHCDYSDSDINDDDPEITIKHVGNTNNHFPASDSAEPPTMDHETTVSVSGETHSSNSQDIEAPAPTLGTKSTPDCELNKTGFGACNNPSEHSVSENAPANPSSDGASGSF